LLMWWRSRHKVFVGAAYAIGVVLIIATTGKEIEERFMSIVKENTNARWATWDVAIRMANDRPIFGFGIRVSSTYIGTGNYVIDVENRMIHSQYFQTAADSGWPALFLYLALLLSVLFGLWQTRRVLRKF